MESSGVNEQQIFNTVDFYMNKPKLLKKHILDHIYDLLDNNQCTKIDQILEIILEVLYKHVKKIKLQIAASTILIDIVKKKYCSLLLNDVRVKRLIITTLLTAMCYHKSNKTLMFNGFLIMYELRIDDQDMMYEYGRLTLMVLHSLSHNYNNELQKISLYLFYSITYQVNRDQKNELEHTSALKKIMPIVKDRLQRKLFDDIHEMAWATLCNLTDGGPRSCKMFLDKNGLKYFLRCLKRYPNINYQLQYMMGLMNNIAEMKEFRPRLMKSSLINVIFDHMFSTQNGVEVSYNAVAVIAHLVSDGVKAWTIKTPARCEVLNRMTEAVQNWNLNADRILNYHTFKPMLELSQIEHTPQCAIWATWTLANLTNVYPEKYCPILIAEDGLRVMKLLTEANYSLIDQNKEANLIHNQAQTVINQCAIFAKKP